MVACLTSAAIVVLFHDTDVIYPQAVNFIHPKSSAFPSAAIVFFVHPKSSAFPSAAIVFFFHSTYILYAHSVNDLHQAISAL